MKNSSDGNETYILLFAQELPIKAYAGFLPLTNIHSAITKLKIAVFLKHPVVVQAAVYFPTP